MLASRMGMRDAEALRPGRGARAGGACAARPNGMRG